MNLVSVERARLRTELEWLQRGPPARTSRSRGTHRARPGAARYATGRPRAGSSHRPAGQALELLRMLATAPNAGRPTPTDGRRGARPRPGRLSYNEQRELRSLERTVPSLEARRDALHDELVDAAADHVRAGELARTLDEVMADLDRAEERWLELQLRSEPTTQEQ